MQDVRQSIASHEGLHDYIRSMTNNEPDYFHPIDVMMHEWDYAESLESTLQDEDFFRIERLTRWMSKVVDVDKLLAQATEEEGN